MFCYYIVFGSFFCFYWFVCLMNVLIFFCCFSVFGFDFYFLSPSAPPLRISCSHIFVCCCFLYFCCFACLLVCFCVFLACFVIFFNVFPRICLRLFVHYGQEQQTHIMSNNQNTKTNNNKHKYGKHT